MSSIKVDLERSALTVSAARASSRGTGLAPGADGGGVRERLWAVRCSAVCSQIIFCQHTYPGRVAVAAVVRGHVSLALDEVERGA